MYWDQVSFFFFLSFYFVFSFFLLEFRYNSSNLQTQQLTNTLQ